MRGSIMSSKALLLCSPALLVLACGDDDAATTGAQPTSASTAASTATTDETTDTTGSSTQPTDSSADATTTAEPDASTSSSSGAEQSDTSSAGPAGCGNGQIDGDEACDGDMLGEAECLVEGEVACNQDCTLDLSGCEDTIEICANGNVPFGFDMPATVDIDVDETAFIEDVNVSVQLTHQALSDIDMTLFAPEGTTVGLLFDQCAIDDDIDATFDDEGDPLTCGPGEPAIMGSVQPAEELGDLIGLSASGTWSLELVDDLVAADDGFLTQWCLVLSLTRKDPVVCGDDVARYGEACDGDDLNDESCATVGDFSGGTLACSDDCTFETSACTPR
ncbi:MAG: proprotein convertase P-domain-containing protein [Myxococcota bacterium]